MAGFPTPSPLGRLTGDLGHGGTGQTKIRCPLRKLFSYLLSESLSPIFPYFECFLSKVFAPRNASNASFAGTFAIFSHRNCTASHYLRRNRTPYPLRSSLPSQEMTMRTLSRFSTFSPAGAIPWLLNLATRMLACALNMPEPLVQNTGVFVFAHVQAVENSIGK